MPHTDRAAVDSAVTAIAVLGRSLERTLTEITLTQYRMLTLIAESPQRASDLASRVAITRASMSSIANGLVERGLVQRRAVDGDGRGVELALTSQGEQVLVSARRVLAAQMDAFMSRFDSGERAEILAALNRISTSTGQGHSANHARESAQQQR